MDSVLLQRINHNSRHMAWMFHAMAGLVVGVALGVVVWGVVGTDSLSAYVETRYLPGGQIVTPYQLAGLIALALVGLGLWFAGLRSLARMFTSFRDAEPLNLVAAQWMRCAGQWFLAASLYAIVVQVPNSLLVSAANPVGERFIAVKLGSDHLSGLLSAVALLAVARILVLAAQVRAEHRQIV